MVACYNLLVENEDEMQPSGLVHKLVRQLLKG